MSTALQSSNPKAKLWSNRLEKVYNNLRGLGYIAEHNNPSMLHQNTAKGIISTHGMFNTAAGFKVMLSIKIFSTGSESGSASEVAKIFSDFGYSLRKATDNGLYLVLPQANSEVQSKVPSVSTALTPVKKAIVSNKNTKDPLSKELTKVYRQLRKEEAFGAAHNRKDAMNAVIGEKAARIYTRSRKLDNLIVAVVITPETHKAAFRALSRMFARFGLVFTVAPGTKVEEGLFKVDSRQNSGGDPLLGFIGMQRILSDYAQAFNAIPVPPEQLELPEMPAPEPVQPEPSKPVFFNLNLGQTVETHGGYPETAEVTDDTPEHVKLWEKRFTPAIDVLKKSRFKIGLSRGFDANELPDLTYVISLHEDGSPPTLYSHFRTGAKIRKVLEVLASFGFNFQKIRGNPHKYVLEVVAVGFTPEGNVAIDVGGGTVGLTVDEVKRAPANVIEGDIPPVLHITTKTEVTDEDFEDPEQAALHPVTVFDFSAIQNLPLQQDLGDIEMNLSMAQRNLRNALEKLSLNRTAFDSNTEDLHTWLLETHKALQLVQSVKGSVANTTL